MIVNAVRRTAAYSSQNTEHPYLLHTVLLGVRIWLFINLPRPMISVCLVSRLTVLSRIPKTKTKRKAGHQRSTILVGGEGRDSVVGRRPSVPF